MRPNLKQDRARADADARKTSEGSAQLTQIDNGMNSMLTGFRGRSDCKFADSIFRFNAEKAIAIANLSRAFDDFALGEGKFAHLIELYDEETQIK